MPVLSALGEQSGLVPLAEWEARRARDDEDDGVNAAPLTPEEEERFRIIRYCLDIFDDAQKAREPFDTFETCWKLYLGDMWPVGWPQWRGRITFQAIRALITFMQAIMTDNKPRLHVNPCVPGSEDTADLLTKLVDRDWDENNMQQKESQFALNGLIWGTGFMKITYDPYGNGGRGKHLATPVLPYRVWTNRTATCIEDCEYLIHVEEVSMGWVRRNFPDKANVVYGLRGISGVTGTKDRNMDYVLEGTSNETSRVISAQNVNGNIVAPQVARLGPDYQADRDTIEIMECWLKDDTWEPYDRPKVVNGKPVMENVVDKDGEPVYEVVGQRAAISEIDGVPFMAAIRAPKQKPVMERVQRLKYPNGRLVMIAAGRVLLRDIPNPFQTDGFPWAMWKDYDTGAFWGQGEPIPLKDLAIAKNRIASEVYNILDKIGNPSYMLDKNAGIHPNAIKNRPGMIIAMDGMDKLKPLEKPPIPGEFFQLFEICNKALGQAAGVNDSIQGNMPASNTAFATIDQLTEAGSAPIRLKVRNLETGLTRIGRLRMQLIQQFDARHEPGAVRLPDHETAADDEAEGIVKPASDVAVRFQKYTSADLQGQVDFAIEPISSLSVSPASVWQKWLTMYDKHLIDRRWWHAHSRISGYRTELPRLEKQEAADKAAEIASKDKSSPKKPGPTAKQGSKKARRGPTAPPPISS